MIFYSPINGDATTTGIVSRPRTCFLMTQLGRPIPAILGEIRDSIIQVLKNYKMELIDADSVITGRDFLIKIWDLILGVPLGIAIIHKEMRPQTLANIFYEIGLMQAYGKDLLVIKTQRTRMPSDFARTEYIEFSTDFVNRLGRFVESHLSNANYYAHMADQLERNPLLAIDYLKRAYLISGEENYRMQAKEIFESADIQGRAKNSVEMLLVNF
jgi:hypothetical protein